MSPTISTELLLRLLSATPEQYAAVERVLGVTAECGMRSGECGLENIQFLRNPSPPAPLPIRLGEGGVGPSEADVVQALSGIRQEVAAMRVEVGELRNNPPKAPPVSDNEALRLFALAEALESETNYRKAPVLRVFLLYCSQGLKRNEVAKKCRCSPSLITLRLQAIEKKLGRKASELRQWSGHFDRIADSLKDDRARRINRASALDEPDEEWDE